MKKSLALLFSLILSSSLFAAGTVIEAFDTVSAVSATSLRAGDTMNFTAVAGDKSATAIKCDYNIGSDAGAWYLTSRIMKEFTTPIDLSAADYFSIDIKMLTENVNMMSGIQFEDIYGGVNQMVFYPFGTATPNASITHTFALSDNARAEWMGRNAIDMKHIKRVYIMVQNGGAITSGTNLSFVLDNLKYYSGTSSVVETVIDNFNYASIDAMTTSTWKYGKFTSRPFDSLALLDDGNGGKKLKMTKVFAGANAQSGLDLTLATPINLTNVKYFKFSLSGDTIFTLPNNAYFALYFGDTAGNYFQGLTYGFITSATTSEVFFPFEAARVNYPTTPWSVWANTATYVDWKEFQYWRDGAGSARTDMTAINKIVIAFTPTGTACTGSAVIDNFVMGSAMPAMPKPSTRSYNVHKINVGSTPVIDGNDSEWTPYPASEDFVYVTKSNTVPSTEQEYFKAAYDDNYLYVMMKAVKPNWALGYTLTGGPRDPGGVAFDATHEEFGIFWSPLGVDQAAQQYHTIFVPTTTGQMYIWDEINWGGASSWDATGDAAAYTKVGNVVTVEYKIPFTIFDKAEQGIVTAAPTAGSVWGVQLIQTPVTEFDLQWEPNGGWSTARPYGSFVFTGTSSVSDWAAMAE